MSSENVKYEVKSSKDFCQIDGKPSPPHHRPPTEQKPQQTGNAYQNVPGNKEIHSMNEVKETKSTGSTSVSEVPPVRKCGFKILKVVEYVDPDKPKEITPPVINTGWFQGSKEIENNVNETLSKNHFPRGLINENESKTQIVREVSSPVIASRFKVTKVDEDQIKKPEVPLASDNNNRFYTSKEVLSRFKVTKVDENQIKKPEVPLASDNNNRIYMNKEVFSRFKVTKVDEEQIKKPEVPLASDNNNRFYMSKEVLGRFKVTKVDENQIKKPEDPLAFDDIKNRFYMSKDVDINSNEIHKKEVQSAVSEDRCEVAKVDDQSENTQSENLPQVRFYMCKIVDKNANKPQMQVLQFPMAASRLKRNSKLLESENGEKIKAANLENGTSTTDSPLLNQEYLNMDEGMLFQELSVIMNEAQTWINKIDEIESNDKLEKGAISHRAVEIKKNRTVWLNLMKLRQTLDPSYYEPTPKDYDCDLRVRLYAFLRKSYTEVHFNSFYMIAKLKEHESEDPNSQFGISIRTECIKKIFELQKKLDACEEALNF